MLKKVVTYLTNLWYDVNENSDLKGGILKMQGATMKYFYEQVVGAEDENKSSKVNVFVLYYYYRKIKKAVKQIDCSNYIEKNKNICNGKAVIKGTRIQPIVIMRYMFNPAENVDESQAKILSDYPSIKSDAIMPAVVYYIKTTSFRKFLKDI